MGPTGTCERALAQLFAVWLNFAHGAVAWDEMIDTDGDGHGDMACHQVVLRTETIVLDSNAARDQLEYAKDLVEAVNLTDEDTPACSD